MWQVSNEMDIDMFRGPLSTEQVERFLLVGARGLKKGNPEAKVDINAADFESAEKFYRDIYSKPDTPFDYAGIDGYLESGCPAGRRIGSR